MHLFFPGPQKPEEQIKKEPRSTVKHEVLPLGGSDFEIDKPLLQNEKVQTFNYLITADTFRSQNLRVFFFFKRYWILSIENALQFVKVKYHHACLNLHKFRQQSYLH